MTLLQSLTDLIAYQRILLNGRVNWADMFFSVFNEIGSRIYIDVFFLMLLDFGGGAHLFDDISDILHLFYLFLRSCEFLRY